MESCRNSPAAEEPHSETGSLETASSTGESYANLTSSPSRPRQRAAPVSRFAEREQTSRFRQSGPASLGRVTAPFRRERARPDGRTPRTTRVSEHRQPADSRASSAGRARRQPRKPQSVHRAPKIEDVIDASRSPARRRGHGTGPDIQSSARMRLRAHAGRELQQEPVGITSRRRGVGSRPCRVICVVMTHATTRENGDGEIRCGHRP